jgi:hypothetical protein
MLTNEQIQHVIDLLNKGITYRKIQKLTGVSRGTVANIASGKVTIRNHLNSYERKQAERLSPVEFVGPPVRCPECGRLVYPPCRACFIEKKIRLVKTIDCNDLVDSDDKEISLAFHNFTDLCESNF